MAFESSFFDDFLSDMQSTAEQSFSNFGQTAVASGFDKLSGLIGISPPAKSDLTADQIASGERGSHTGTIDGRATAGKGILRNIPFPNVGGSSNMIPILMVGGAIVLALFLRRK